MQLRFLEGDFKHGRFKLQYRDGDGLKDECVPWKDVPCEKEEPKIWCEHIHWRKIDWDHSEQFYNWYIHAGGWGLQPTTETMFCPICGKERPKGE